MPRSSFSKNPLLRVSRPISACSRCRTAKVKCDGKLPACTACQKAGREDECSSANDQFARGKERSYVAALELRIEKLERRLQYAKSRKASVANYPEPETTATSPEDGTDRRDSLASIRDAIHRKAARTRENSDVNSLVSDFGFMSVNATTRDFEPMGNMTFARLVLAATLNDPVPPSVEINVPPRQATNSIVNHFLANIYTLYPCFSETALWTVIDDFYKQDNRLIKESDYWLMFMVLAIGSAAQSKTLHDAYYDTGVEYLAKALQHADRALAPGNVTQIQSLLLLTIYSMLDPAHFDTWHLIGFTARAVIDLGLHQDPPSSTVDRAALDMRRRIFYCTYAMDRAVSMVHARTFSFTDETTNVAFPSATTSKDSISRKPSETGPMTAPQSADPSLLLFQLRRAQSFWYQELYQSDSTPLADPTSFLWQMCLDMREWGESLPITLPAGIRRMFDQELRYSYVYCIAPSVRAPQITDYTRSLIFEHALEYLNVMHEIAHTDLNSALYTYHDALKVYFMGNQFLAVIRDAEDVILSGRPIATPPSRPGCPPPPPIPRRHVQPVQSPAEMIQKSLRCLQCIPQTLAKYGERWEEAVMLMQSFQQLSKDMVAHLQNRQVNASSVPQQQQPQQLHQQQQQQQILQQQQQQQQMQQMNAMQYQAMPPNMQGQQPWVGINVSQMMHGGPPR